MCEELAGRSGTAALLSTEFNLEERCKQVEPVDQSQNEKHAKPRLLESLLTPTFTAAKCGTSDLPRFDAVDASLGKQPLTLRNYIENNMTFNYSFKQIKACVNKLLLWTFENFGVSFSHLQLFH